MRTGLAACGLALGVIATASATAQPRPEVMSVDAAGTWDLDWATRQGPQRRGYLVISQNGEALRAEIHGRGAVDARGRLNGRHFELRGSRMMVSYRIDGDVDGDRLTGTLRVLSVERRFTGRRRR